MNAINVSAFAGLNDALLRRHVTHFMLEIVRMYRRGTHVMGRLLLICVLLVSHSGLAAGQAYLQFSYFPRGGEPAFKPENRWWGPKHQEFVRDTQAGCRNRESVAYRRVAESVDATIKGRDSSYELEKTYASILGALKAKSVADLPTPSEFDAFFEGACRILVATTSELFYREHAYCFAIEQDVAAFAWEDGVSRYKHAERVRALVQRLLPGMRGNCQSWMKKEGYLAGAYAASINYEAEQATIAANKVEQEQRREQEARRTRENQAELARQRYDAVTARVAVEMKRPFEEAAIAEHDQIIWERTASRRSDNRGATGKGFPDSNTLFNELNAELERRQLQISQHVPFTPPGKGEFETTAAHKERVDVLKAEHAKQVSAQRNIALEQWTSTRAEIFHEYLGEPAMEKLTYNADKEMFSVRIKTASAPYYVDAFVNVPLTSAPAVKAELEGASIKLGFALVNGVLEPKVLLLHTRKDLWVTRISNSTQVSMRFGTESARAWATAKSVREHEAAGRRDAQAQREAQRQQKEAEARRAAYQHNGPFLSKGALVCTDAKSMIRAAAIQRANNHYVSLPGDCIIAQGDFTPVTDLQRMNGGLVRVVIKSNGIPIFSMERYLVH